MKSTRQITGTQGEQIAAQHLQRQGYVLLEANWRCAHGEIDLVVQQADMLVFVEVKTRRRADTAAAFLNITPRKRERLIASAHTYLAQKALENSHWRIDGIAVILPRTGEPVVEHVEDVLGW